MALFGKGQDSGKNDRSSLENAAKTLLANIRFISVDDPVCTMAITSAVPNEGKTFVTANLASAIATSGKTVLLVECDMRRRSMAHMLNAHAQHGIYEVLSGETALADAVIETHVPNLYFLDAEPHIPNPSDLLSSERFTQFVEHAADVYDYVLFDTPPVGTFVDAAVLGTKMDAVFMVVREGYTKKADISAAAEQLRKSGCNLAGIVMNYCERKDTSYYYEYYYSEGHRSRKKNSPELIATADAPAEFMESEPVKRSALPLPKRPERRGRHHSIQAQPVGQEVKPITPAPAAPAKVEEPVEPAKPVVSVPVVVEPEPTASEPAVVEPEAATTSTLRPIATPFVDTDDLEDTSDIMNTDLFAALAQRARRNYDDEF